MIQSVLHFQRCPSAKHAPIRTRCPVQEHGGVRRDPKRFAGQSARPTRHIASWPEPHQLVVPVAAAETTAPPAGDRIRGWPRQRRPVQSPTSKPSSTTRTAGISGDKSWRLADVAAMLLAQIDVVCSPLATPPLARAYHSTVH
jgi:hypothetical protein